MHQNMCYHFVGAMYVSQTNINGTPLLTGKRNSVKY